MVPVSTADRSGRSEIRTVVARHDVRAGEVTSVPGGGQISVEIIGGGPITVSGVGYAVGQRVFIRDNAIRSEAPDLSLINIDV